MVHLIDSGGGGISRTQAPPSPRTDPAVERHVAETARYAQDGYDGIVPTIDAAMNDPSLSQAQRDAYVARLIDLAAGGDFETGAGPLNDAGRAQIVYALETLGAGHGGAAGTRDQVTDAFQRLVADGRIDEEQLSVLVSPEFNPASDGVRQLMSGITDGAVLQRVAYDLYAEAIRGGLKPEDKDGLAMLASAADIAGMAADYGFVNAANSVTCYVADHPKLLDAARNLQMNFQGAAPPGRGAFDAFASALAGTSNTSATPKFDQVFSKMVDMSASGGVYDETAGLNSLGDYFNRHIERLNQETTYAGGWNERAQGAEPPTPYHGLTERFVRNVMLGEGFDNPATQRAISDELVRLGNIAGAPGGGHAPNEAERTEAATQFGTLMGSMQGAANAYVAQTTASAEEQVKALRMVTDLVTGGALKKTGELGGAFGGKLVDHLWSYYAKGATKGAADDVDTALGDLNDLGEAVDQAFTRSLRETYPTESFDRTGVNGPGIIADYESTVDIHRTNPS